MNSNNCDTCDKKTFVNPDRETVYESEDIDFELPIPVKQGKDKETGADLYTIENKKQTKTIKKPVMTYQKRMDQNTGKIVKYPIAEVKFLQPLTVFIRLKLGGDIIQRDFCEECIRGGNEKAKEIFETAEKLWSLLEDMK